MEHILGPDEATVSPTEPSIRTDLELVERFRSGSTEAFEELYQRHYEKVFNFALRLDGSRDDAQDLAQTAFLQAYKAASRLNDGQAFLKFVYRVVVNLVRDKAKNHRRHPVSTFLDIFKHHAFESDGSRGQGPMHAYDSPELAVIHETRDAALRREVAGLPLEFREPMVLYYFQGLDVDEVGKLLGIPQGTVKSRLGRARQRLRSSLDGWADLGDAS